MESAHDRNQWQPTADQGFKPSRSDWEDSPSSEELLQIARMITVGELSASFAHEVFDPLNLIRGHLRFVDEGLPADSPLRINFEVIDRACGRIEDMVRRMLDFSRKQPSHLSSHDPGEIVHEAIRFMQPYFQEQFADVKVTVAPGLPRVQVDRSQFVQALVNVLQNAAEAMSHSEIRTVSVTVTRDGEILRIAVADTGGGIADKDLARIFAPYFSTKGDQGTGLGLYITRKIVEEQRGDIAVQTNSAGTTFVVSLPVDNKFGGV
jgi:signal transduction histidine kinase